MITAPSLRGRLLRDSLLAFRLHDLLAGGAGLGTGRFCRKPSTEVETLLLVVVPFFGCPGPRGRRETGGDFLGVVLGVEGEQTGEDAVARLRGPEIAAPIVVVVLGFLGEKFRAKFVGEVAPAIVDLHGAVHFVVQRARAGDRRAILSEFLNKIVDYSMCGAFDPFHSESMVSLASTIRSKWLARITCS